MTDSPAARRILGEALHAKPQTPDEAYEDLVRILREPTDGTGPRIAQGVPFMQNAQRTRTRPLHPYHSGPAIGVSLVIGLLVLAAVMRWVGKL